MPRGLARIALLCLVGCGFDVEGTGKSSGDDAGSSGGASSVSTTSSGTAGTAGTAGTTSSGSGSQGSETTTASAGGTTTVDPSDTRGSTGAGSSGDTTAASDTMASTGGGASCHPLVVEILPSNVGSDDGLEWAKLYNPCPDAVDLSVLSLGWGGASFGSAVDLQGSLAAGGCFVIGGPLSDSTNAFPSYDQVHNYDPNLSRDPGAMLLYDVAATNVDVQTVPLDSVVWGSNSGGYLDPTGAQAPVAAGNPNIDVSLQRTDENTWTTGAPSPDACPSF